MAPAGPSPPRPAAGTPGPASHPGPGGGVTATAEEHQPLVRVSAPAPGAVGVNRAERPAERGEGGAAPEATVAGRLYLGHRAHSARPGALAHAHCAARTLPNPRRPRFGRRAVGLEGGARMRTWVADRPRVLVSLRASDFPRQDCQCKNDSGRGPEPSDEASLQRVSGCTAVRGAIQPAGPLGLWTSWPWLHLELC